MELELHLAPREHQVPCKVYCVYFKNSIHHHISIEDKRQLSSDERTILFFLRLSIRLGRDKYGIIGVDPFPLILRLLRRLLGLDGLLLFGPDEWFPALPEYLIQLLLELLGPGPFGGGDALQGLIVLVEEVLRQLVQVVAVLELGHCDLRLVLEVPVLVQDLMDFVLYFSF